MHEKIYTIPVNEAFDKNDGCPFCALKEMLVSRELELLMGGSMMEPDVRVQTNEQGFCEEHLGMLIARGNRLGIALILESRLNCRIIPDIKGGVLSKPAATAAAVEKDTHGCYICTKTDEKLARMIDTAAYLYENDGAFAKKLRGMKMFCLTHYAKFMNAAKCELSKKSFAEFASDLRNIELAYASELSGDVSQYAKKFDYRYKDEPWGNSKDSIERTLKFLK